MLRFRESVSATAFHSLHWQYREFCLPSEVLKWKSTSRSNAISVIKEGTLFSSTHSVLYKMRNDIFVLAGFTVYGLLYVKSGWICLLGLIHVSFDFYLFRLPPPNWVHYPESSEMFTQHWLIRQVFKLLCRLIALRPHRLLGAVFLLACKKWLWTVIYQGNT